MMLISFFSRFCLVLVRSKWAGHSRNQRPDIGLWFFPFLLDFHAFSLAPAEPDHPQLHRNTTNQPYETTNNIEISSNRNDLHRITTPNTSGGSNQAGSTWTEQQNRDQEQSKLWLDSAGFRLTELELLTLAWHDSNLKHWGGVGQCSLFVLQTGTIPRSSISFRWKDRHHGDGFWYHMTHLEVSMWTEVELNHQLEKIEGQGPGKWIQLRRVGTFLQDANELTSHHSTHITHNRGNNTTTHSQLEDGSKFILRPYWARLLQVQTWFTPKASTGRETRGRNRGADS